MKDGLQKFLRKMIMDKFPEYLDVYVEERMGWSKTHNERSDFFEVYLVTKNYDPQLYDKVEAYVYLLAKYMNVRILSVFNEVVTDEEWEEMKSK